MTKVSLLLFLCLFVNNISAQEYKIRQEEHFLNKKPKKVFLSFKADIKNAPASLPLLMSNEKTANKIDSISKLKSVEAFLKQYPIKQKIKILNTSNNITFEKTTIRFIDITSSFTIFDENYTLNFEKVKKYALASEGTCIQKKNKLHITIPSELVAFYNKESKEWAHFNLEVISLLQIFERSFIKGLIKRYYNSHFIDSSQKWDQESITIFRKTLKEDWHSKAYRNLDFETFCNCKIKNYEKFEIESYSSNAFHDSIGKEISARCLLISEQNE